MFSTDNTLQSFPGQSSRNPRRRHRSSVEDNTGTSGQAPKRRKRSSITTQTFEPPTVATTNGSAFKPIKEHVVKENGAREKTPEIEAAFEQHAPPHQNGTADKPSSLVLRNRSGRSNRERKPARHEEGILLAKNDRYQVSKETNLPDEVQDIVRAKDPWQARFNEELGHVVLFTHQKAVVWRYAQSPAATQPRITVIKFQNAAPKPKDPLPIGAIVHDLGAGELALLVIKAGGKVTYWESIANAANADILRQKQNGRHGSISGLASGEQVVAVEEAEPDGFVLTTTTGRVLHLSVRDSQGRPTLTTEILRSNSMSAGGLFGGLKNVFNIASRGNDIAAVRCTNSRNKAFRKCLIATKQGILQVWTLARQANRTLELQVDVKEALIKATKPSDGPLNEFQVMDMALLPGKKQQDDLYYLLLLVAVQIGQSWSYSLVEVKLQDHHPYVGTIFPLTVWSETPDDKSTQLAPVSHLHVPGTGHTAIITFDKALLVASLTPNKQGPDAQLQNEDQPKADAFQDILYFAKDRDFHILGCASDPSTQSDTASCLFFVHDFGLAQITAARFKESESIETRKMNQCRTKLEQVVFFGDAPNKLFDFHRAMDTATWTSQQIQAAALEVNSSILNSSSSYVPVVAPSMDHLLKDRSAYLRSLIKFISKWDIDTTTRWTLLWSAEKMAAARAVWQVYSGHLLKREEQKIAFRGRNTVLLWEAIDAMGEDYKHEIDQEKGENDVVRQFLTRDIGQLQLLIAFTAKGLEIMAGDNITNAVYHAWLICQASDVIRVALDTAFRFRESNAALYGFATGLFVDGIFTGKYMNLPEIWTSCAENCYTVPDLARYAQEVALSLNNGESSDEDGPELDENDLIKLIEDAASLARLSCQIFEERSHYQDEAKEAFKEMTYAKRRQLLVGLIDLMVPLEGLKLAEKYRDLPSLAEIVCRSKKVLLDRLDEGNEEEQQALEQSLADYEKRIAKYFEVYGMSWAQAYYSEKMARESISDVLKAGGESLSEYLAKNSSLTKAKWMYDVGSQQEYKGAVHDLLKCNADEMNLWNKKVQLSLAKLSLLAAKESGQVTDEVVTKQMRHADRRLTTIEIQDALYNYTRPHLSSALDRYAEVELAMGTFGKNVKNTELQAAVFKESIEKLVTRRWIGEMNLIDALTTIFCPADILDDMLFGPSRFFFALQTLRDSPNYEDINQTSLILKIIWRRCIIQDDWSAINITEFKSDDEVAREAADTALFKTLLVGFQDGLLEQDLPPPHTLTSLLEVGTTPDELRSVARWRNIDEATLVATARDYAKEDQKLREILDNGRLGLWWDGLVSAAKTELRRRLDDQGEIQADETVKTMDTERDLRAITNGPVIRGGTRTDVHTNGFSGTDNEAEPEGESTVVQDGEGDVVMG